MSKRKYIVVQVLEPEEVSGYSEAQKAHYVSLGYMPCLLANGTTKWLTESQRVLREAIAAKPVFRFSGKTKPARNKRSRRKHRSQIHKFWLQHWRFISILLGLTLAMWVLIAYWTQIFG